jgi:hypothetical protein
MKTKLDGKIVNNLFKEKFVGVKNAYIHRLTDYKIMEMRKKDGTLQINIILPKDVVEDNCKGIPIRAKDFKLYPFLLFIENDKDTFWSD